MLVLRPDFGVEEKDVRNLLTKLFGDREVTSLNIMGKKTLAYPIAKQTEGVYVLVELSGAPVKTGDLEKTIKLGTDVLRYLLTAKE